MPPMFIAKGDVALFALKEKTFNANAPNPLIIRSRGNITEFCFANKSDDVIKNKMMLKASMCLVSDYIQL